MSSRPRTPTPQRTSSVPAVPANTPMLQPATPGASSTPDAFTAATPGAFTTPDTLLRTPSSRNTTEPPKTPGSSLASSVPATPGRIPGGSFKLCTANPAQMIKVPAHTARCDCCNKRNSTDQMLRCPGCAHQFCKPCQEKREKEDRTLVHGSMMTPGALGLGTGGPSKRRKLPSLGTPGLATPGSAAGGLAMPGPVTPGKGKELEKKDNPFQDVQMANITSEGVGKVVSKKGKEKADVASTASPLLPVKASSTKKTTSTGKSAGKKRAAKEKSVQERESSFEHDSLDDDWNEYTPESPTANKRKRITFAITDTPTATSTRPTRHVPSASTKPNYAVPSSPAEVSDDTAELASSVGRRPTSYTTAEANRMWETDVAPDNRIQELLEQHGVNTPGNRYKEHFLMRCFPAPNPSIEIPQAVRNMASNQPRLTAVDKINLRNKDAIEHNEKVARGLTVRGTLESLTARYQNTDELTDDQNEELADALKDRARKWANFSWAALTPDVQAKTIKGLDMRLDKVHESWKAALKDALQECAITKVKELKGEGETQLAVGLYGY